MAKFERTAKEIAEEVLKIKDRKILNKIDGILSIEVIEERLLKIMSNKQFPNKTINSIVNFFETYNTSPQEKMALITALEDGMIKSAPAGTSTIQGLVDSKYGPISKTSFFIDFCEMAGNLKDSKESQGSTGTGAGEVLLCMLIKDGFLPSSKGDINIFGKGMEVKSSSGRIATFNSVDQKFVKDKIKKKFGEDKGAKDLKELIQYVSSKPQKSAEEFFIDFWVSRSTERSYAPILKKIIGGMRLKSTSPKDVQTLFGKSFIELYQKSEGWSGIMLFKDSKNFAKTNVTTAYNTREFEKLINFSGLGMTNGNQPVYLVAKSK